MLKLDVGISFAENLKEYVHYPLKSMHLMRVHSFILYHAFNKYFIIITREMFMYSDLFNIYKLVYRYSSTWKQLRNKVDFI